MTMGPTGGVSSEEFCWARSASMRTSRAQLIFKAESWLGCRMVAEAVANDWMAGRGAVRDGTPLCRGGEEGCGGAYDG